MSKSVLADPVDNRHAIVLGLRDNTVNSSLGDGGKVEAAKIRMTDKQKLLRLDLIDGSVRDRHDRRLSGTLHRDGESLF